MKLYTKYFIALISATFLFTSCEKNSPDSEGDSDFIIKDAESILNFTISGISESENEKYASKSVNQEDVLISQEIVNTEQGDFILSAYEEVNNSSVKSKLEVGNKVAAAIGDNVQYRLLILELNPDNSVKEIVSSTSYTGKAAFSIGVYRNRRYKWVVYTNNNNALPATVTMANPNLTINPSGPGSTGEGGNDFAYASDILTTSNVLNAQHPISVTLKRQTANIRLIFNMAGESGTIERINTTIPSGSLTNRSFNIFTGLYANTENSHTSVINSNDLGGPQFLINQVNNFTTPALPLFDARELRYMNFYVPPKVSTDLNFKVNINGFDIQRFAWKEFETSPALTQPTMFKDAQAVRVATAPVPLSFKNITPVVGKTYLLKVDFIQSGWIVNKDTPNEVVWARDNVYGLQKTDNSWFYRLASFNQPFTAATRYPGDAVLTGGLRVLNDASATTSVYATKSEYIRARMAFTSAEASAACAQIYPAGYWRLPTVAEYERLIAYGNTMAVSEPGYRGFTAVTEEISRYASFIELQSDQGSNNSNTGYRANPLVFTHHGYINNGGNFVDLHYNETASIGYYRTTDPNRFFRSTPGGARTSPPGFDIFNNVGITRANVRCVKNQNFGL